MQKIYKQKCSKMIKFNFQKCEITHNSILKNKLFSKTSRKNIYMHEITLIGYKGLIKKSFKKYIKKILLSN